MVGTEILLLKLGFCPPRRFVPGGWNGETEGGDFVIGRQLSIHRVR
jgi:hypothetical protein